MSDETLELSEEYKAAAAKLLQLTEMRENAAQILKFSAPQDVQEAREYLAKIDDCIESLEDYMESEYQLIILEREFEEAHAKLVEMSKQIDEKLPAYVAEHCPERLEEIQAILEFDGKEH